MAAEHTKSAFIVFLVSLCFSQVASDSFYIQTSSDQPCPGRYQPAQCMTLQQYITNSMSGNLNMTDEIHLELQSGQHNVSVSMSLWVYNTSFHMNGTNATLHCTLGNVTDFVDFTVTSKVNISGVSFFNCGTVTFRAVSNVVFQYCLFQESGPLVMDQVSNGTVINSLFEDGYGIKLFDSSLQIKRSKFFNLAALSGYTLTFPLHPQCEQRGGGAITSCNSTLMVNACFFTHNVALSGTGGAILADNTLLSINNSSFTNNTASSAGGAIYIHKSLTEVNQSKFIANSIVDMQVVSGEGGGAIFVNATNDSNDTVSIYRSCFSMNMAHGKSGGALHVYSMGEFSVSIQYSTFEQNTASTCAAFKFDGENASVSVDGSSFTNNTASDTGGVGCIFNSTTVLANSTFKYNEASKYAGVLHTENSSLYVLDSYFIENSARQNGGVMYTALSPVDINVRNSLFDRNQAQTGGVMDVEGSGSFVTLHQSTLTFNGPGDAGGVIAISGSELNISQSSIFTLSDMDVVIRACNSNITLPDDIIEGWSQDQNSTCTLYVKNTTAITTSSTSGTTDAISTTGSTTNTTEHTPTTATRESGSSSSKTVTATLVLVIILFVLVAILYVMVTAITLCLYSMIKGKRGEVSNPNVYVPMVESDTHTT